jgi:hypothetical protein
MNALALTFLAVNVLLLLLLPRRWAPLPFLIGACYMTMGQVIEVGPFHFSVIRMLVAAGLVRVLMRGERFVGRLNAMDWLIIAWGGWMLISSVFHKDPTDALILRLGLVYNACGIYFLLRVFCRSIDDVVGLCRITAILLVPLALEMLYETMTGHDLFSILGRVPASPVVREGRIRAQGPFAHSILAGSIGAVSLPFAIALWRRYKREAVIGIAACSIMIFASASSGPILSAIASLGALFMWHYRNQMRLFRWLAVLGYIVLGFIMTDPAYFIIARIGVVGGSTGWHRARLIQSAFEHLSEWWKGGTDYTRHWMATGVSWSPDHTDITNYYLRMGVWGGLPLMLIFIFVLARGFSFVGQMMRYDTDMARESRFMIWAFGASLFSLACTFISVSFFDQSFVFLYLTLAVIGSSWSMMNAAYSEEATSVIYQPHLITK